MKLRQVSATLVLFILYLISVRPSAAVMASYSSNQMLRGNFTIAGSATMQSLLSSLERAFQRWHPEARITIESVGSSVAVEQFIRGMSQFRRGDGNTRGHFGSPTMDAISTSRPLTDSEVESFRSRHGYSPTAVAVALDAIAIYVNRANPVRSMTLAQVKSIFTGAFQYWGDLGAQEEWSSQKIRKFGRDERSGTRQFFQESVLGGEAFHFDVVSEPGPASVVLRTMDNPAAIGYSGLGKWSEVTQAKMLPIAAKEGMDFVAPAEETMRNGSYPLSRTLYIYLNKAPDQGGNPLVLEFLRFINTAEASQAVSRAGFFPISEKDVETNLNLLAK